MHKGNREKRLRINLPVTYLLLVCFLQFLCGQSSYNQDFLKMAKAGQTPLVKALLDAGTDVHARDENGLTALMLAAAEGHYETVMVLLDQGAEVNEKDENGTTALMMAERNGHSTIVRALKIDPQGHEFVQTSPRTGTGFSQEAWESDLVHGQQELQHGHYDDAEEAFSAALERAQKLGEDDPLVAMSLSYLGLLYLQQGKYAQAESLYQRALDIAEKVLGPEHPDTAGSLNNLGGVYLQQGKYAQAESLYQRALDIAEKVLGPEHPDTATSLNNLAALYHRQENYAQAEPLYRRALDIAEKVLGPEHLDTADSLNSLAALYRQQGEYAQAESLYQRALDINEKVLGPEHPDTVASLVNLGSLYGRQGKYAEAEPLYRRILAINENQRKSAGSSAPGHCHQSQPSGRTVPPAGKVRRGGASVPPRPGHQRIGAGAGAPARGPHLGELCQVAARDGPKREGGIKDGGKSEDDSFPITLGTTGSFCLPLRHKIPSQAPA